MLLLIKKKTDTLIEQTKVKPKKRLSLKQINNWNFFHLTHQ